MIGVIGGSGLYELLDSPRHESIPTPYGESSSTVSLGTIAGKDVAFLTRHGRGHSVPPHLINYRANLWTLEELGAHSVITSSAVGSLRADYAPGSFIVMDQFVDRTWGRPDTFFEGPKVTHVSVADPYCPVLRGDLIDTLTARSEQFHPTGTAVVIQGPRFSTRAESRWFQQMGWDVLSMTQHPETTLARELGMCCANLSFVSDLDAGIEGIQDEPVTEDLVWRRMAEGQERIRGALHALIERISDDVARRPCSCRGTSPEL